MVYTIQKLKLNGWYDFSMLPQEHRYVKVHSLNCGSDKKARNMAKKIVGCEHTIDISYNVIYMKK